MQFLYPNIIDIIQMGNLQLAPDWVNSTRSNTAVNSEITKNPEQ